MWCNAVQHRIYASIHPSLLHDCRCTGTGTFNPGSPHGHLRHGICVKAAALPRDSLQPSTSGNVPCATWLVGEAGMRRQTGHGAVRQDRRGGMIEFHMGLCSPSSPSRWNLALVSSHQSNKIQIHNHNHIQTHNPYLCPAFKDPRTNPQSSRYLVSSTVPG